MGDKKQQDPGTRKALLFIKKMEAITWAKQGKSVKEIADEMDESQSVIRRWLNFGK